MLRSMIVVLTAAVVLAGCANHNSISRRTYLPGDEESRGVAIHLDAKQRLAIHKEFGAFCAEPSPDALSVAASSIGSGTAATGQGNTALAAAFSEGGASIGLRTQTITLMRDAFYRICELYYSKALDGTTAAQMHRGYQDVIVALLAIEQLTGAVSANQAGIGSTASSTSSSIIGAVEGELAQAKSDEAAAIKRVNDANAKLAEASADVKEKEAAVNAATTPEEQQRLNVIASNARTVRDKAQVDANEAKANADTKTAVRVALENARGVAISTATASSSTSVGFSTPGQAKVIPPEATVAVANAVERMVVSLMDQDPVVDACIAFLMDRGSALYKENKSAADLASKEAVRNVCTNLIYQRGLSRPNALTQAMLQDRTNEQQMQNDMALPPK